MKSHLRSSVPTCAAMLFAGSVSAADIANVRSIGFSADGQVFAFEEYGVLDGSGFPYANIYALDLSKDTYLPGTPFRVRLEQPGATLARARWQVRDAAENLIETREIANNPGEVLAFNPITEVDSDPHKLRYRNHAAVPPVGEPSTLVLEEVPQPPDTRCEGMVERTATFRLRLTEKNGKPVNEVVYADERLPASRRCVSSYRLGGIINGHTASGAEVQVALVMAISAGFEGKDGRWLAIPTKTVSPDLP